MGAADSPSLAGVSQEFIPINNGECGMLLPAAVSQLLRVTAPRQGSLPEPYPAPPFRSLFIFCSPRSFLLTSKVFLPLFPGAAACESPAPSCLAGGDAERVSKRCSSAAIAQQPEQGKEAILLK